MIIANTLAEAQEAVKDVPAGNAFGEAGHRVVIEEFLAGEEASFICMVDGLDVLPMATSQDHKAAHEGDQGQYRWHGGLFTGALRRPSHVRRHHGAGHRPTVQGMLTRGVATVVSCTPES